VKNNKGKNNIESKTFLNSQISEITNGEDGDFRLHHTSKVVKSEEFKPGTRVTVLNATRSDGNRIYTFDQPNPSALALNIAIENGLKAKKLHAAIKTKIKHEAGNIFISIDEMITKCYLITLN